MPSAHRSPGILQPPCIKDLLKALRLQSATGVQTLRVGVLLLSHHGKTVSDSRTGWGGGQRGFCPCHCSLVPPRPGRSPTDLSGGRWRQGISFLTRKGSVSGRRLLRDYVPLLGV